MKNKKVGKENELIENYETVKKSHDFKEKNFSETTEGLFEYDQYSSRIMKRLCYADRPFYENLNYFVLMATSLTCLNEISYLWLIGRSKK